MPQATTRGTKPAITTRLRERAGGLYRELVSRHRLFWRRTTWHKTLSAHHVRLQDLNSASEKEFIAIGTQFQAFHRQATDISRLAKGLVDQMTGQDLIMAMQQFQTAVSDIDTFLKRSDQQASRGVDTLDRFLASLADMTVPVSEFGKIVRILHIMAISTKIENAHFDERETGFNAVADEIRRMADVVGQQSADIADEITRLRLSIRQELTTVLSLRKRQEGTAREILERIHTSLGDMQDHYGYSQDRAGELARLASELSAALAEIIISMQFNDITRQQIEHVQEALADAGRMLGNRAGLRDMQNRKGATGHLSWLTSVTDLQVRQLQHADRELTTAVDQIKLSLETIAEAVTRMVDQARDMASRQSGGQAHRLGTIEAEMQSIREVLIRTIAHHQTLRMTFQTVCEAVTRLSEFVGHIDHIGHEIRLIALNALVKAAHTGKEGLALAVLAESIQKLSVEALEQAGRISGSLKEINQLAHNLAEELHLDDNERQQEIHRQITTLEELMGMLRQIDCTAENSSNRIEEEAVELAANIKEMVPRIRVHEASASVIGDIVGELGDIQAALPSVSNTFPAPVADQLLDLENRYTMESERLIHQSRGETADPVSGGETLSPESLSLVAIPVEETGEDFGDNVELF